MAAWCHGHWDFADPFYDAEVEDGLHQPTWLLPYAQWHQDPATCEASWRARFDAYVAPAALADPPLGKLLHKMRHVDPCERPTVHACLARPADDEALALSADERAAAEAALIMRVGWARAVARNLNDVRRWRPLLASEFPEVNELLP